MRIKFADSVAGTAVSRRNPGLAAFMEEYLGEFQWKMRQARDMCVNDMLREVGKRFGPAESISLAASGTLRRLFTTAIRMEFQDEDNGPF